MNGAKTHKLLLTCISIDNFQPENVLIRFSMFNPSLIYIVIIKVTIIVLISTCNQMVTTEIRK